MVKEVDRVIVIKAVNEFTKMEIIYEYSAAENKFTNISVPFCNHDLSIEQACELYGLLEKVCKHDLREFDNFKLK